MQTNEIQLWLNNIQQKNYVALNLGNKHIQELIEAVVKYAKTDYMVESIKTLSENYWIISSMAEEVDIENDVNLQWSYYLGILKTLYDLQNYIGEEKEQAITDTKLLENTKWIKSLISLLYHEPAVTQKRISEELKLSTSATSNFLSRNSKLNIYTNLKKGRNNYYYITAYGRKVYKALCEDINKSLSPEEYNDFFLKFLRTLIDVTGSEKQEINAETIIRKIFEGNLSQSSTKFITKPKLIKTEIEKLTENINKRYSLFSVYNNYKYQKKYDLEAFVDAAVLDSIERTNITGGVMQCRLRK
ncbi:MAG: MarR family winged helix-turn-helix transcriptional regulator [Eubacteriales bacterium]|nr:MarR family winged helix-turn-helix transcriptional regulator [Eubacteriales bacterium]